MTSARPKAIALVLVAVVIAAGAGYWLLAPMTPSQLVTYTTQQTSLVASSEQIYVSSTKSTAVTTETTL